MHYFQYSKTQMSTDNTLWSESKTKSLMDDVVDEQLSTTTVNKHVSDDTSSCQICLFCLEGSHTSFYIKNPIRSTEIAYNNPPTITITIEEDTDTDTDNESDHQEPRECATNDDATVVKNFGDVFPCDCAVHTHGTCLQQWLNREQTCPICRTPIEDGVASLIDGGDDDNEMESPHRRRPTPETTTTSCPIRSNGAKTGCCCCIAIVLVYVLLFSNFAIP